MARNRSWLEQTDRQLGGSGTWSGSGGGGMSSPQARRGGDDDPYARHERDLAAAATDADWLGRQIRANAKAESRGAPEGSVSRAAAVLADRMVPEDHPAPGPPRPSLAQEREERARRRLAREAEQRRVREADVLGQQLERQLGALDADARAERRMYAYDDIGVGWLEKVDAKIAGQPVGGRRYSESALERREAREARRRAEVDGMVATVQQQVAAESEGRGRRGDVPRQRAGRDVDERGGWFAVEGDADDDGWGDAA